MTLVSSTGLFNRNETVNLVVNVGSGNDFRDTPQGLLTTAGVAVQITDTGNFDNNIAQLDNNGKLKIIAFGPTDIDLNGIYITDEPTITTTTNLPPEDTCGKRWIAASVVLEIVMLGYRLDHSRHLVGTSDDAVES